MTTKTIWICAALSAVALATLTVIAPGAAQQRPDGGMAGGPPAGGPAWMQRHHMMGPSGPICDERLTRLTQFRMARIERVVRPTEAQRAAFEELKSASTKAADLVRAACPTETYLTPPGRLEATEKLVEARLAAIRTVRPALQAFYATLSDEQKARFNVIARPAGNRFAGDWRGHGRPFWHQPGGGDRQWGERPGRDDREPGRDRRGRGYDPSSATGEERL